MDGKYTLKMIPQKNKKKASIIEANNIKTTITITADNGKTKTFKGTLKEEVI